MKASVEVFRGIRFARADRFGPPKLVEGIDDDDNWDARKGAADGPQCPQVPSALDEALGSAKLPMDEDCLFLNVYTPARDAGRRPVLVWVHGGAFQTGTGSMAWFDGTSLAGQHDVVVVTINYRLGALGYLGVRNAGVLDQIAALAWVQAAIGSFGGDPANVTVFGESAGGASVIALMATPRAEGLFHRAVAMSPSLTQLRGAERAREAEAQYLSAAGVGSVDGLGSVPVAALLAAQTAVLSERTGALDAFAPAVDGDVFHEDIVTAAAGNPVPLVIGTTRDEMMLFTAFDPALSTIDDATLLRWAERRFGQAAPAAVEAYRAARPGFTPAQLNAAMQTDETFRVPARRLAEQRAQAGHPTWMYWFTWATPAFGGLLGSCHGLDIPFTFDNLDRPGVAAFTGDHAERVGLATDVSHAIVAMARDGQPGWPAYEIGTRSTRRFDVPSELVQDPEPGLLGLWAA